MKLRNLSKWQSPEDLSGLLFFAQRMDELLFDYTLDSYKPTALNPPSLCREALDTIDSIEKELIDQSNLKHILEELRWAIQQDKVSRSLLDVSLEHYILASEETPLAMKKLRLEVLAQTLEIYRYIDCCEKLLLTSIKSNHKQDISDLSRTLVTSLVYLGVSKAFLYQTVKEYFFSENNNRITSNQDAISFFDLISPVGHDFNIYCIASKHIKAISKSIHAFKVEILDSLPTKLDRYISNREFIPNDTEVYVQIKEIYDFDYYSARENAERRLERLRDFFTIYYHKNELTWRDESLIEQCCSEVPKFVGMPKNPMNKIFDMPPKQAAKRLNRLINNLAIRFGESFDKFIRIVELHGTCVLNKEPENQLLNLWTSLETLAPSHAGKNKINTIAIALDPFVRMTYVRRLVDCALFDLVKWDKVKTKNFLRQASGALEKSAAIKLLHILSLPEHNDIKKDMYTALEDFHLLRFRLYSLSKSLSSPKHTKQLLDQHSLKVKWQIHRIYRTRNLIIHSAATPKYIGTMIENGHDYLDMILNRVTENSCNSYRIKSFEQAFELEKILSIRLHDFLKTTEKFTAENIEEIYCQ